MKWAAPAGRGRQPCASRVRRRKRLGGTVSKQGGVADRHSQSGANSVSDAMPSGANGQRSSRQAEPGTRRTWRKPTAAFHHRLRSRAGRRWNHRDRGRSRGADVSLLRLFGRDRARRGGPADLRGDGHGERAGRPTRTYLLLLCPTDGRALDTPRIATRVCRCREHGRGRASERLHSACAKRRAHAETAGQCTRDPGARERFTARCSARAVTRSARASFARGTTTCPRPGAPELVVGSAREPRAAARKGVTDSHRDHPVTTAKGRLVPTRDGANIPSRALLQNCLPRALCAQYLQRDPEQHAPGGKFAIARRRRGTHVTELHLVRP